MMSGPTAPPPALSDGTRSATSRALGCFLVLVACSVLIGWALDIHAMRSFVPGAVSMNPMAAICFLAVGAGLLIGSSPVQLLAAGLLMVVGLARLADVLFAAGIGLDQLLFTSRLNEVGTGVQNHIAPNTAAALVISGVSFGLARFRRLVFSQVLAVTLVGIAYIAITGYCYDTLSLYGIRSYIPMSLPTAICIFAVAAGILSLTPRLGLLSIAEGEGSGAFLIKRVLPFAFIVPVLIAMIRLRGEQQGLFDAQTGSAMVALISTLLMAVLITWAAATLQRKDQEKARLEAERDRKDAELQAALIAAEAASEAKSTFLANMSHEIRTPMNGVVGLAKLMLRTQLTESQQGYARAISESGESLVGIINDILDFSKIEAGKMDLESEDFDLCELIEDVATLCGPRAHEAGVDLVVDVPTAPVIATGDTLRVRQIVSNLLGNALKFTPEGTVAVALSVAGNGVSIEVRDTGIGISEDRLESIFATFTQADSSSSRRFGGTGLGLTIARQLAQKMGGDIEVSSEVGKGSTFRVFLALTTQVSGVSGPILEGTRVGICCPHPDIARVVSGHIRNWGGTPVFAEKLSDLDTDVALIAASELAKLKEVPISKVIAVASPIQAVPSLPYQKLLIKPVRRGELAHALAPTAGFGRSRHTVTPVDAKPLEGRHILLAEDNSVNQLLATALLEDWGATVDLAEDGVETVEKVTAGAYDAVLMDCQMPRLSGFEATQQIRKLGTMTSTVPIIALTANAMESDRQRCLAAGMDAYISKPLDADQLLQELLSLVSPEQPSQP